ncbi:Protein of unknown function DUF3468 [Penicillium alfredii]|uniref:Zn(2)-C6 fungal-type domain-containing protein n=1 Tax=Penicillium alfredii TaxID=1506179 RepID=A0A9W9GAP0_9EURO|nr:Protein of unknown function DUF3468 [Penicillium alfredii]KAJ5114993.1 Protein of unknown function DUF3468 [Penicillium alfredii]
MAKFKKPRGIRHDRDCRRCKLKGIKCDLNRPRCQACLQGGAACYYPQRVVWMEEKSTRGSSLKSIPRSWKPQTTLDVVNTHRISSHYPAVNLYSFVDLLADFYQQIQSRSGSIPDDAIQLIFRTLSFARSRLHDANHDHSIQSHVVALTNLRKLIESADPIALFGIATFAIFEVCCGSFGNWHCHLQGAHSLLDLHCRNTADFYELCRGTPGLAEVLAYLVWFDATGALVRDSHLIFEDWHRDTLLPSFFDSVGCPPDTFQLFVYLVKQEESSISGSVDLSARAMDQILRLDSGESSDRGLAAIVYRCAGAIVAFSRAGSPVDHAATTVHANVISSMVDRVCEAIARIPTTSRFYVHLATPAYLTAKHACTATHYEVLRAYWQNCRRGDFPRYPDAQAQCERRWCSRVIS